MTQKKYYHSLLKLESWHRYAITILFIAIITLLWLFLLYLPMHKDITTLQSQFEQSRNNLSLCITEQQLCKKLTQEVDQLQKTHNYNNATSHPALQQIISSIIDQLHASELHLLTLKKEAAQQKNDFINITMITNARGSLQALHNFFKTLHEKQMLMQCSQLTMQCEQDLLYSIQGSLRLYFPQKIEQNKIPSTLEKAEGLGGKQHF